MFRHKIIVTVIAGSVLFGAIVLVGIGRLGSAGALIAYVHGSTVWLSPSTLYLGELDAGTTTKATFALKNLTANEMSIVGMLSSCSCAILDQVPLRIPPRDSVRVDVDVHLPKKGQVYERYVEFLVAEPNCLTIHPAIIKATLRMPQDDRVTAKVK